MKLLANTCFTLAVVLIAAGIGLAAMGINTASEATAVNVVNMGDNFFAPQTVTVPAGSAVEWKNEGQIPHTTTSNAAVVPAWDSSILTNGQTHSQVFNAAGSFKYHCAIHPEMVGVIVVQAAAPAPTVAPIAESAGRPPAQPAPEAGDVIAPGALPVGGGPPGLGGNAFDSATLLGGLGVVMLIAGAVAMGLGARTGRKQGI